MVSLKWYFFATSPRQNYYEQHFGAPAGRIQIALEIRVPDTVCTCLKQDCNTLNIKRCTMMDLQCHSTPHLGRQIADGRQFFTGKLPRVRAMCLTIWSPKRRLRTSALDIYNRHKSKKKSYCAGTSKTTSEQKRLEDTAAKPGSGCSYAHDMQGLRARVVSTWFLRGV